MERSDTMLEQVNIRKAELNRNLLQRKNEETDLKSVLQTHEERMAEVTEKIRSLEETRKVRKKSSIPLKKRKRKKMTSFPMHTNGFIRTSPGWSRCATSRSVMRATATAPSG